MPKLERACRPARIKRVRAVSHANDARFVSRTRTIVSGPVRINQRNGMSTTAERVGGPDTEYASSHDYEVCAAGLHDVADRLSVVACESRLWRFRSASL